MQTSFTVSDKDEMFGGSRFWEQGVTGSSCTLPGASFTASAPASCPVRPCGGRIFREAQSSTWPDARSLQGTESRTPGLSQKAQPTWEALLFCLFGWLRCNSHTEKFTFLKSHDAVVFSACREVRDHHQA